MSDFGFRLIVSLIVCPIIMYFGFYLLDADQDFWAGVYFFMGGYVWALLEIHWLERRQKPPNVDRDNLCNE